MPEQGTLPNPKIRTRRASRVFMAVLCALTLCACTGARASIYRSEPLRAVTQERDVIVVDLDGTVVSGSRATLCMVVPFLRDAAPLPEAARVLRQLSETHQVAFLTARCKPFARGTLAWLDANGFPRAPVIFATTRVLGGAPQVSYKSCALSALVRDGWRIVWGVGDSPSDVAAYRSVGARPILVLEDEDDRDARIDAGARVHVVTGHAGAWAEIEALVGDREPSAAR